MWSSMYGEFFIFFRNEDDAICYKTKCSDCFKVSDMDNIWMKIKKYFTPKFYLKVEKDEEIEWVFLHLLTAKNKFIKNKNLFPIINGDTQIQFHHIFMLFN